MIRRNNFGAETGLDCSKNRANAYEVGAVAAFSDLPSRQNRPRGENTELNIYTRVLLDAMGLPDRPVTYPVVSIAHVFGNKASRSFKTRIRDEMLPR